MVNFSIAWSNKTVKSAFFGSIVCTACTICLVCCVSITRSLVLTSAAWLSVFSLFLLVSTVVSCSVSKKPTATNTFGFSRAPVMAVFAATVLASLSAIFLMKEGAEHLLEDDHHIHPNGLFLLGAAAVTISLITAAYGASNQPFQHVLTASSSSSLQEHFADISHAFCYVVPGLSVLLLPRLNAMSLLAFLTSCACIITHWFTSELWYVDAASSLVLSVCVVLTMWPLSTYTGRILLQTSPPHIHNQIDRCISEASTIEGVLELRNAHFWQLDFSSMAGSIDVRVRRDADEQSVLAYVTEKLSPVVSMLTVQVVKDVATSWHNFDTLNVHFGNQSYNTKGSYGNLPHEHETNMEKDEHDFSHTHSPSYPNLDLHDGGEHGHFHSNHSTNYHDNNHFGHGHSHSGVDIGY